MTNIYLNHHQLQTEAVQTSSNDERDVLVDKFVSSSSNQDLQSCSSGETAVKPEKEQDVPTVSERQDVTEPAKVAPLGLGVSGLERKVSLLVIISCLNFPIDVPCK